MPSSTAPEEELWSLVSYLRSLNAVASVETATGRCNQPHAPLVRPGAPVVFVTARETCATYLPAKEEIVPGRISNGGTVQRDISRSYGALRAIDPITVERRWEFRYPTPTMAGVMSTASGLVFAGDDEGNFMAFDAHTGKNLWFYPTGSAIWGAAAMTFMLDGRQYVLIGSGTNVVAFALPASNVPTGSPTGAR
jgi:alcohol dehydrogenase (cytochrome c)